jgi:hypothetical protein
VEENNRATILKAAKDRARQSEEQHRVQMIADSIGERRERDLLDLLSQIEQERGWSETVEHLMKAQGFIYALPIGTGSSRITVEPLKYREMLFSTLGCNGLEPVLISTSELLNRMKEESSLIDASVSLRNYIESVVKEQIETGDILFFSTNEFGTQITEDISQLIESMTQKRIQQLHLGRRDDKVNIAPLWQCENSRLILSELGVKGYVIDVKQLDEVLSVIQFPISIKDVEQFTSSQSRPEYPSNEEYRNLHRCIINHDTEGLCSLSSRHSLPTLRFLLEEVLDFYTKEPLSDRYRRILNLIHMHVRIRTLDSIQLLESLTSLKDIRIATVAITALGNYYNESAAAALVELLCRSRNREIVRTATGAILNVGKKCPETYSVIMANLESSTCKQKGRLKRLLRDLGKKPQLYY